MSEVTTVQIKKKTLKRLRKDKDYSRQTYNKLIPKMLDVYEQVKRNNQCDEFLHKIQQPKTKKLWDNLEDED
ncbi:MAG: hypothetical protein R6U17_06495 [Thermoplasmata archaeon]